MQKALTIQDKATVQHITMWSTQRGAEQYNGSLNVV